MGQLIFFPFLGVSDWENSGGQWECELQQRDWIPEWSTLLHMRRVVLITRFKGLKKFPSGQIDVVVFFFFSFSINLMPWFACWCRPVLSQLIIFTPKQVLQIQFQLLKAFSSLLSLTHYLVFGSAVLYLNVIFLIFLRQLMLMAMYSKWSRFLQTFTSVKQWFQKDRDKK